MKTTIETISEENGILTDILSNNQELVRTGLGDAIIGFSSWQELCNFQEENRKLNLQPAMLSRFFGHDTWHYDGFAYKAIDPADYSGIVIDTYLRGRFRDENDYFEEEVRNLMSQARSFSDAQAIIDHHTECWETIKNLKEDEQAVLLEGGVIEVMPLEAMKWDYDSTNYTIGLINAK